ncbi:MAG: DUF58 domain-containing protein [Candidatus Cloacimonadota bacterium]|nr:MAG: DUF58 domain-containing protein [Candidatus Cloacimonadota bacterium]PIE78900.1 MAG: DUF58 domain-containing protein [Candidatus Delongbacteria bacterium]
MSINEKDILKRVKAIEIKTRGIVNQHFSGEYHSRFKGRGMNFSEVREYSYGDDVRTIDWNVSARMKAPFIKVFEEERELVLMLLVDISGSGSFGSDKTFRREIATEIAAVLAFSAIKNNDKVGLILFSDKIEKFVPPKKGKAHVFRIIRELIYHKEESHGTDIGGALEYLNRVQKKRCSAFLISDFLSSEYEKELQIVSNRHDLVGIDLSDKAEENLDKLGFIELYDNESGKTLIVDLKSRKNRETFRNNIKNHNLKKEKLFNKNKVDKVIIDINSSYIKPLMTFFKSRSRS